MRLSNIEATITSDHRHLFTTISCILVMLVYINLVAFQSSLVGLLVSIAYFLINAAFLGSAFFQKEDLFFRLTLGLLSLIMLLTFASWLALIVYNLDSLRTTIVLASTTILASLSNKRMRKKRC